LADIAAQVALHRTRLGLTQHDLARQVGTSHSAISRLEGGQHATNLRTLQRIAAALDLDLHITLTPRTDGTSASARAPATTTQVSSVRRLQSTVDQSGHRHKTTTLELWLRVENNNKFLRGKSKVRQNIEDFHLRRYGDAETERLGV
jgi:transcriptional regulator with XRE-family HTH domain